MRTELNWKQKWAAYSESFKVGARLCMADRADFISMIVVYGTLMVIMAAIYRIMPIAELGRTDITRHHLLWYFAITEIVVVSMQGNQREFGHMIADGQITTLIQRPGNMMGMLIARLLGNIMVNTAILCVFAATVIPLMTGVPMTMPLANLPLLFVSIILGITIFLLMGHMVGMLEIFGSYSSSTSLILGKFIFAFGGLFFPVIFFPKTMQTISAFTPFPAVITVPGNFMLNPTKVDIVHGLLEQILWLGIMTYLAVIAERRLVRHILLKGD